MATLPQSASQDRGGFTPPPAFIIDEKTSKTFDFNHEPIEYRKGTATERIEPEGKTWSIRMNLKPPNKPAPRPTPPCAAL